MTDHPSGSPPNEVETAAGEIRSPSTTFRPESFRPTIPSTSIDSNRLKTKVAPPISGSIELDALSARNRVKGGQSCAGCRQARDPTAAQPRTPPALRGFLPCAREDSNLPELSVRKTLKYKLRVRDTSATVFSGPAVRAPRRNSLPRSLTHPVKSAGRAVRRLCRQRAARHSGVLGRCEGADLRLLGIDDAEVLDDLELSVIGLRDVHVACERGADRGPISAGPPGPLASFA